MFGNASLIIWTFILLLGLLKLKKFKKNSKFEKNRKKLLKNNPRKDNLEDLGNTSNKNKYKINHFIEAFYKKKI